MSIIYSEKPPQLTIYKINKTENVKIKTNFRANQKVVFRFGGH